MRGRRCILDGETFLKQLAIDRGLPRGLPWQEVKNVRARYHTYLSDALERSRAGDDLTKKLKTVVAGRGNPRTKKTHPKIVESSGEGGGDVDMQDEGAEGASAKPEAKSKKDLLFTNFCPFYPGAAEKSPGVQAEDAELGEICTKIAAEPALLLELAS